MAFFDKLSKAVTETGQKAIAKTKDFADTAKLNSMISEEEKKVANYYYQIGKLYYSIYKDDPEEDFAGMIVAITDTNIKIANYKKRIREIKGVQCCENCGAEVLYGAAFCSSCGAAMPKSVEFPSADYVKCENCGANVKKGMRFCSSCGEPVNTFTESSAGVKNNTETSQVVICPRCGAKAEIDAEFCIECGAKL